jgi:NADH dehydrogenase/NADH:ubiquinone oxidoreductase subunit G
MREYVSLTIDGAIVRVPKGTTVLDAALEYGICIPHLCHIRGLQPTGACRLCLVEVGEPGHEKVTASCTLTAEEGMVVHAHSERIMRLRRNVAELLVASAPNSRAVQDVAVRCGVTEVRYPFHRDNCILCGRCVRACTQLFRGNAIGFVGRGKERRVAYPLNEGKRPDFCKRCNACITLCPMTITPCIGPFAPGEEQLCARCESQLSMAENMEDQCVWCELGKGFDCQRQFG